MSKRKVSIVFLVLFLQCALLAFAQSNSRFNSTLELKGSLGSTKNGSRAFLLNLRYDSQKTSVEPDAILVFAVPSNTLLMAHINSSARAAVDLQSTLVDERKALGVTSGPLNSSVNVAVPYDPSTAQDKFIVVKLMKNGHEYLLSNGGVNVSDFSFSLSFDVDQAMSGAIPLVRVQ